MIRYNSIKEARKNPKKNPFIGAWDYLDQYKDDPDVYISFTNIDKIGINPQSGFNTPNGIYTYPLKEFYKKYFKGKEKAKKFKSIGDFAPFAGTAEYINFLKLIDKSHFVSDMYKDYGSNDYDRDIKILEKKYKKQIKFQKPISFDLDDFDEFDPDEITIQKPYIEGGWDAFLDFALTQAKEKNPIMSMWNITRMLAQQLTTTPKAASTKWNLILSKDLGYAGFADKSGKGYIHPSEPTQAVFLRKNAFKVLHRVENKPAKNKINIETLLYYNNNLNKVEKDLTEDDILDFINLSRWDGIQLIKGLKNPSEKLQLLLIDIDIANIKFIKNPSEKVQLIIVKIDPNALKYIKKPTKKVLDYVNSKKESIMIRYKNINK